MPSASHCAMLVRDWLWLIVLPLAASGRIQIGEFSFCGLLEKALCQQLIQHGDKRPHKSSMVPGRFKEQCSDGSLSASRIYVYCFPMLDERCNDSRRRNASVTWRRAGERYQEAITDIYQRMQRRSIRRAPFLEEALSDLLRCHINLSW